MTLPEILTTHLAHADRSQVAEACGVSPQAVSKWRLGQAVPTPENLPLLCEFLRIELRVNGDGWECLTIKNQER